MSSLTLLFSQEQIAVGQITFELRRSRNFNKTSPTKLPPPVEKYQVALRIGHEKTAYTQPS